MTETPDKAALREELVGAAVALGFDPTTYDVESCDVEVEAFAHDEIVAGIRIPASAVVGRSWASIREVVEIELALMREELLVSVAVRRRRLGLPCD